jgi:predicted DNA-binding protein (UPF0251 family)
MPVSHAEWTQDQFGSFSLAVCSHLKSIVFGLEDFQWPSMMVYADRPTGWQPFLDLIVGEPAYGGTISCVPWHESTYRLEAATATEAAWMLLRAFYNRLFEERPRPRLTGDVQTFCQSANVYLARNATAINERIKLASDEMHVGEWLKIIAAADRERAGIPARQTQSSVPGRKRKRNPEADAVAPLTSKQLEVCALYGQLGGNMSDVARKMGITRQCAQEHYDSANKKLGLIATARPSTRRLHHDPSGQGDRSASNN